MDIHTFPRTAFRAAREAGSATSMHNHDEASDDPIADRLETAVSRLLDDNARLREQNQLLEEQVRQLKSERAAFKERNEQARHRVENMIARLRSMEHSE